MNISLLHSALNFTTCWHNGRTVVMQ